MAEANDAQRRLQAPMNEPKLFIEDAIEEFNAYLAPATAYSAAVRVELVKYSGLLSLLPASIDRQWDQTSRWVWGPDSQKVRKYLSRACEIAESD